MTSVNSNQHTLSTLRRQVDEKKTMLKMVKRDITRLSAASSDGAVVLANIVEAQKVIQHAAELTQKQLQHRISDIVTLAMASIFDDPYTFKANFTQKRNNVECELMFNRRGEEIKPLDDSGFGTADVASLSLRFSVWKDSGSRAVLFFDEPGRNVSEIYRAAFGTMLKMLSDRLSVQVICVSHMVELHEAADKVFLVTCKNDQASVEEVIH